MVISIAIQFYHQTPENPEIDGHFPTLNGIRMDIENTTKLFGKNKFGLYYDIFPDYSDQNIDTYTAAWTESQLIEFLKEKADELEYTLRDPSVEDPYDGLLVIISCHGIRDYIITSDYKKINKTAIHRIFSGKKPLSRKIPRMFIFDCCSGHREREARARRSRLMSQSQGKSRTEDKFAVIPGDLDFASRLREDSSKNVEVVHITRDETLVWASQEKNPDFKLVVIHAANDGFQSKMNTVSGSYVIGAFVKGLRENVFKNGNKKFLHEILCDIQEDLHDLGKQLMVKTFNNKTEWIKFVKNKRGIKRNKMSLSFSRSGRGSVEIPEVKDEYRLLSDGSI